MLLAAAADLQELLILKELVEALHTASGSRNEHQTQALPSLLPTLNRSLPEFTKASRAETPNCVFERLDGGLTRRLESGARLFGGAAVRAGFVAVAILLRLSWVVWRRGKHPKPPHRRSVVSAAALRQVLLTRTRNYPSRTSLTFPSRDSSRSSPSFDVLTSTSIQRGRKFIEGVKRSERTGPRVLFWSLRAMDG